MYYVSRDFSGKVLFVDVVWTKLKLSLPESSSHKITGFGSWQLPKRSNYFPVRPHSQDFMYAEVFSSWSNSFSSTPCRRNSTRNRIFFIVLHLAMPFCVQKTFPFHKHWVCNLWWLNHSRKQFNSSQNLWRTLSSEESSVPVVDTALSSLKQTCHCTFFQRFCR